MKMSIKNIFKMFFKSVPYVYHTAPFVMGFLCIIALIYSFFWFLIVPANNYMFDTVLDAVNGKATVFDAVLSILLVLAVLLIQHVLNGLNAYNNMYQYYLVSGSLHKKVNEKVDEMNPIDFEDAHNFESIDKAKLGIDNAMWLVNIFSGMMFFYIPQLVFYSVYFYKINKILVIIVFVIFIPQIIASFLNSKFYINLENEISPYRRKLENYDDCMTSVKFFKETKILGAYSYFNKNYQKVQKELNQKKYVVEKKIGIRQLGLRLLTLTGYGSVIWVLVRTLMSGKLSIASFSAIFISLTSLVNIIKEITFGTFSTLSSNFGSIYNFISFMERKPACRMENKDLDYSKGIKLQNVSFKYPNTERKALDGINLELKPGETIAIVGENGAGKTTLAKLILGIFQPQEGKIVIGNVENKQGNPLISHKNTSVIYQNFQKFAMTLKENIQIGDVEKKDDIFKYTDAIGMKIDKELFVDGEDTILSPEFGGINLSGGQWQKVAMARGLYRNHDFIVLDEPTSAIDPIEECRVFELFHQITKEKSAVIITHRLGSVKMADRIVVLEDGKIVEIGTHENLLKQNGKYAFMYQEQAKWYDRG